MTFRRRSLTVLIGFSMHGLMCLGSLLNVLVSILPAMCHGAELSRRPNILFCISDDQSWLHTGASGSRWLKTPNFDRISREGVRFTHCFVSNPTCCPSRASFLTGQAFYRLGEGAQNWGTLNSEFMCFPDFLEDNGYYIGFSGKGWGPGDWSAAKRKRNPTGPAYNSSLVSPPSPEISRIDYSANFRNFLKTRPKGSPFSFWYGSTEPHREFLVGSGLKAGKKLDAVDIPPFLPDRPEIRSDMLDYAQEIEWFDRHLGLMIEALEEVEEFENTIIVITSDNGMPFPRSKGQLYDTGTRVPLAIRWGNKVDRARVVDDFICSTDFAPTFLEAAGVNVPPQMTGRSFLNVLLAKNSGFVNRSRDHVVLGRERYYPESLPYPCRAIRTASFLYIVNFKPERGVAGLPPRFPDADGGPAREILLASHDEIELIKLRDLSFGIRPREELYDINSDPWQLTNVAEDSKYAAVRQKLASQLEQELKDTGDPRITGHGDVFDSYPARLWNETNHKPLPPPVPD